ncbi:hypothetical protein Tco_0205245 [Tanacetum coccineum]
MVKPDKLPRVVFIIVASVRLLPLFAFKVNLQIPAGALSFRNSSDQLLRVVVVQAGAFTRMSDNGSVEVSDTVKLKGVPSKMQPQSRPKKQDSRPPDLNIRYQSLGSPIRQSTDMMVDSQQPDLALQL